MFDGIKTWYRSRDSRMARMNTSDDQEGFNIDDVDLADVDVPMLNKLAGLFDDVEAIEDDDERLTAAKALVAEIGA
jgi:hypothetical protein